MFANKDKNSPATVGDLEELAAMVVDNFATKDEVRGIIKEEVGKVIDDKVGKIVQDKVEKVIGDYTNIILDSNDKLVKKLDTFMTEKTVLGGQIKGQGEEVDKLKNRVTTIEKHVGIEPVMATH